MKKRFTTILLSNVVFCFLFAQTNTFTGTLGSDWNINGNWSLGHVPTISEDLIILGGGNSPSVQSGNTGSCHNLNIGTSALVFLNGGLNVSGNVVNNGTILSDNNNSGGFVQQAGSTYSGTGIFTFVHYDANTNDGYRDICLPVAGTVNDLITNIGFPVSGANGVQCWYSYSPYPNVQVYDEALSIVDGDYYEGWLSYTGTSNPFTPMKGIAVRQANGIGLTYFYQEGVPNNGPQSIAITRTSSPAHPSEEGWNFVGNPYPSSINWPAVAALNPSITGSCYVFHATGEYTGSWGSINSAGVATGVLTADLASGQGFFVQATSTSSFVMDNSVRTIAPASYYKTDAIANEIRLTISNGINNDEIVAYTDVDATNGYDEKYDAVKIPAGSTVNMSYVQAGNEYAINALEAITVQTELPLTVRASDNGNYTISATALHLASLKAYLKDASTNTLYDLSASSPSFNLTAGQTYTGRFSVVFTENTATGVEEQTETAANIYAVGNEVFVKRNSSSSAHISIANVLGQEIVSENTASANASLHLPAMSNGYVFVKLTEGSKVTVAKVLVTIK